MAELEILRPHLPDFLICMPLKSFFARTFLCLTTLTSIGYAQQSPALATAEKLEFITMHAPALAGYLGDPALGVDFQDYRMIWHPSGRIFTTEGSFGSRDGEVLQIWEPPAQGRPARQKGQLNVGYPWVLSNRGDLICSKMTAFTADGSPTPLDWRSRFLGCFRFSDASRTWSLEVGPQEQIRGICFSKDDTKVLVACAYNSNQCTLRVLDAASGAELERLQLPEPDGVESSGRSLAAWGDGFVMLRRLPNNPADTLVHVRLGPLSVETIPLKNFGEGRTSSLCMSRDERWLVIHGNNGYELLENQNGKWTFVLDGVAAITNSGTGDLSTAIFSSNSKALLVASQSGGHVLDLNSRKVIKELQHGCQAAAFAPDDSMLLVTNKSQLAHWETRTWTYTEGDAPQHVAPVSDLLTPDATTLISSDMNSYIVWDLPSEKPRAILKSPRRNACLMTPVAAGGKMVVGGDGWDFIKWPLPQATTPPAVPQVVKGDLAFGGVASQEPFARQMAIFASEDGQRFLTVPHEPVIQLRDMASPHTAKTLFALGNVPFLAGQRILFLDATRAAVYGARATPQVLDLGADSVAPMPHDFKESLILNVWLPQKQAYFVRQGKSIHIVEFQSGKILHSLENPLRDESIHEVVASPDEKRVAATLMDWHGQWSVALWDVESTAFLGLQELPRGGARAISFTADSSQLAVGHTNGAISLWDIATIVRENAGVNHKTSPIKSKLPAGVTIPFETVEDDPQEPLQDAQSHLWSIRGNGSCSVEGRLPMFGRLMVNGFVVEGLQPRHMKKAGQNVLEPGVWMYRDGMAGIGSLWVSRQLLVHPNISRGSKVIVQAVDGLTNVGAEPMEMQIRFEAQLPADAAGLVSNHSKPVTVAADGTLELPLPETWLLPAGSGKAGETVAMVQMTNLTRTTKPALHWDAATQMLSANYTVTVPPGETRWLVHSVKMMERVVDSPLDLVRDPEQPDVGNLVLGGDFSQALNFGPVDMWNEIHRLGAKNVSGSWSLHDPKPKPESDALGQTWERQLEFGRRGQLGANNIYRLWFDRHPVIGMATRLLHYYDHKGNVVLPQAVVMTDANTKLRVTRKSYEAHGGAATVWYDAYTNSTETAQEARVSYVTTFNSPVVAVWDAHGQTQTPANAEDTPADKLGGACAFVLQGEQMPATLLAFHQDGSPLMPTLRWMGPQAVALDFTFTVEPNQSVALMLGACQRPLKAFGAPKDAFADWLPLTRPPKAAAANPASPDTPAPTASQPLPSALNYAKPGEG